MSKCLPFSVAIDLVRCSVRSQVYYVIQQTLCIDGAPSNSRCRWKQGYCNTWFLQIQMNLSIISRSDWNCQKQMTKILTIDIDIAWNANGGFLLMLKIARHYFASRNIYEKQGTTT